MLKMKVLNPGIRMNSEFPIPEISRFTIKKKALPTFRQINLSVCMPGSLASPDTKKCLFKYTENFTPRK